MATEVSGRRCPPVHCVTALLLMLSPSDAVGRGTAAQATPHGRAEKPTGLQPEVVHSNLGKRSAPRRPGWRRRISNRNPRSRRPHQGLIVCLSVSFAVIASFRVTMNQFC
jgi:hypothetical protein